MGKKRIFAWAIWPAFKHILNPIQGTETVRNGLLVNVLAHYQCFRFVNISLPLLIRRESDHKFHFSFKLNRLIYLNSVVCVLNRTVFFTAMSIFRTSNLIGMRAEVLARGAVIMVFAALIAAAYASPYLQDDENLEELDDYDNNLEKFLQQAQEKRASRTYTAMRRSCIRRGGNCDHQFENCCYNSTCRCNLWGSNCRCQRMGLFQKWGK